MNSVDGGDEGHSISLFDVAKDRCMGFGDAADIQLLWETTREFITENTEMVCWKLASHSAIFDPDIS